MGKKKKTKSKTPAPRGLGRGMGYTGRPMQKKKKKKNELQPKKRNAIALALRLFFELHGTNIKRKAKHPPGGARHAAVVVRAPAVAVPGKSSPAEKLLPVSAAQHRNQLDPCGALVRVAWGKKKKRKAKHPPGGARHAAVVVRAPAAKSAPAEKLLPGTAPNAPTCGTGGGRRFWRLPRSGRWTWSPGVPRARQTPRVGSVGSSRLVRRPVTGVVPRPAAGSRPSSATA